MNCGYAFATPNERCPPEQQADFKREVSVNPRSFINTTGKIHAKSNRVCFYYPPSIGVDRAGGAERSEGYQPGPNPANGEEDASETEMHYACLSSTSGRELFRALEGQKKVCAKV